MRIIRIVRIAKQEIDRKEKRFLHIAKNKMIHREKHRCHHRQAFFQLQNYANCDNIEGVLQKMK